MRSANAHVLVRFSRILLIAAFAVGIPGALRAEAIDSFFLDLFGLGSHHHSKSAAAPADPVASGYRVSDDTSGGGGSITDGFPIPEEGGPIVEPGTTNPVPEPATMALCALGIGALAAFRRARR